jgi:hypothetical protein
LGGVSGDGIAANDRIACGKPPSIFSNYRQQ